MTPQEEYKMYCTGKLKLEELSRECLIIMVKVAYKSMNELTDKNKDMQNRLDKLKKYEEYIFKERGPSRKDIDNDEIKELYINGMKPNAIAKMITERTGNKTHQTTIMNRLKKLGVY